MSLLHRTVRSAAKCSVQSPSLALTHWWKKRCKSVYACVCLRVGTHLCFHEAMPSQANYGFDILIMVWRTMHILSERMQKLLWQRRKVWWTRAIFFLSCHFYHQVTQLNSTNGPRYWKGELMLPWHTVGNTYLGVKTWMTVWWAGLRK